MQIVQHELKKDKQTDWELEYLCDSHIQIVSEPSWEVRLWRSLPHESFLIREIKIHVNAKRQTWICTTWRGFPPIFRLPFIASTQK